jgi:hypothetical protein
MIIHPNSFRHILEYFPYTPFNFFAYHPCFDFIILFTGFGNGRFHGHMNNDFLSSSVGFLSKFPALGMAGNYGTCNWNAQV